MIIYPTMLEIPNQSPNPHFLKRYCEIVQSFKFRNLKKQFGFHSHHIIPKSLGGKECKGNKVIVSPREHFVLHWILWKAFPKSSMSTAFWFMSNIDKSRISSRVYENVSFESGERSRQRMLKKKISVLPGRTINEILIDKQMKITQKIIKNRRMRSIPISLRSYCDYESTADFT